MTKTFLFLTKKKGGKKFQDLIDKIHELKSTSSMHAPWKLGSSRTGMPNPIEQKSKQKNCCFLMSHCIFIPIREQHI